MMSGVALLMDWHSRLSKKCPEQTGHLAVFYRLVSDLLGTLLALKLPDPLAAVLDRLRGHHAAALILQLAAKVTNHGLGGFEHELKCLQGIGGPRHTHEKADPGCGQGWHIPRLECAG